MITVRRQSIPICDGPEIGCDRLWRGPAWVTVLRDVLMLVLPSGAFVWEVLKDKPSVELLILFMALLSFPGLAGVLTLARNGHGGIEPPSSEPPSLPPSPQPPSSSTTAR